MPLRGALKGSRTLKTFGLIVNRLVYAFVLLFAVLVLNFTLMHLAPGDVADTISQSMGGADEELLIEIRKDYGLDQHISNSWRLTSEKCCVLI